MGRMCSVCVRTKKYVVCNMHHNHAIFFRQTKTLTMLVLHIYTSTSTFQHSNVLMLYETHEKYIIQFL